MEQIRSFIAIELPGPIKEELASLEKRLKAGRHSFVKWVDAAGIHLTLQFLGSIPLTTVPQITAAMGRIVQPSPPMSFQLGSLGVFPNWERPQVVWVAIGGEVDKLARLQKGLETALIPLGFAPESRAFTAHLTLGRLRQQASTAEKKTFGEWVQSVRSESNLPFQADAISLMKSQLTPAGAIYTHLARLALGGQRTD